MENQTQDEMNLTRLFIRRCKQRGRQSKIADSMGLEFSGYKLLAGTLIMRKLLRQHVLDTDEECVGVLLPPTVPAVIVNLALTLDRRAAVNLNYTATSEVLNACLKQCHIKHVITSRKAWEKFDLDLEAEIIYLEDFRENPDLKAGLFNKLSALFSACVTPAGILERNLGLHEVKEEDLLTIIFTSGSTGVPKGVMLTHANIGSNIKAIDQIVKLGHEDVMIGILPFFHSFGFTATLWATMALDIKAAYHFSPLEGKQIGKLCQRHKGTILLATPTFLRGFLHRCSPEEFASVDVIVTGAEKLPKDLADAFEEKFNIQPVEGYGATELSPLVSVNVPPSRSADNSQIDLKEGTVGLPIPGVTTKITDLDTDEELGTNASGMLWIKGPNVMKGYYGRQDLTDEVILDGWYRTGDVAEIDDDGFIRITGRVSRFSKIGGEMVPHVRIEEMLNEIIESTDEDALMAAVTAVPDEKRGERLIIIHRPLQQTPNELREKLADEKGMPNIFIPSADSFYETEELPLLGTGKLDLKGIKDMAMRQFGPDETGEVEA
ncbi:MAG: AMP-binding protein [Candidatus Poribacteria bacterium]